MIEGQIDNGRVGGHNMDCGTCETAPTIEVIQPKVVDVSLTMTDKAIEMLTDALVMIAVMHYSLAFYQVDAQATCTIYKLSNPQISIVKNWKFQASVCLYQMHLPTFSMESKWIMSTVSWVVDSRLTTRTPQVRAVVENLLLEEPAWASFNLMHMYC